MKPPYIGRIFSYIVECMINCWIAYYMLHFHMKSNAKTSLPVHVLFHPVICLLLYASFAWVSAFTRCSDLNLRFTAVPPPSYAMVRL